MAAVDGGAVTKRKTKKMNVQLWMLVDGQQWWRCTGPNGSEGATVKISNAYFKELTPAQMRRLAATLTKDAGKRSAR